MTSHMTMVGGLTMVTSGEMMALADLLVLLNINRRHLQHQLK